MGKHYKSELLLISFLQLVGKPGHHPYAKLQMLRSCTHPGTKNRAEQWVNSRTI